MRSMARDRARGVSLVEALVALAVMAFGILGVMGVQVTLRATADLSKQRAEAVRIAQAALESGRTYSALDTTGGLRAYADIGDQPATEVTGTATNTTFMLAIGTTDHFTAPDAPRSRAVAVTVSWPDRTGETQSVSLRTVIAGVPPEVAGSLAVPRERNPGERSRGGRHPAIPQTAVPSADDPTSSRFSPPGGNGVVWVFNNITGEITSVCQPADVCVDARALLLAGYVRFAMPSETPCGPDEIPPCAPRGRHAETPPSPVPFPVAVQVIRTAPSSLTVDCFEEQTTGYVAYFCAVPVPSSPPRQWSGRVRLSGFDIVSELSSSDMQVSSSAHRVCRYTPVVGCQPTVGSTIWKGAGETWTCTGAAPTSSRTMTNLDHPLDYANVTTSLANKNFLVIRAGNGSTAFDCPGDDVSTPLINGNTWRHQPSS